MEPPDYLQDTAQENLSAAWDSLGDDDKMVYAKDYGLAGEANADSGEVKIPKRFDPMNDKDDTDYRETQRLAHYLFTQRAQELMNQRKIKGAYSSPISDDAIASADHEMWEDWKGSSTGTYGRLLQVAAADELGGRVRDRTAVEAERAAASGNETKVYAADATVTGASGAEYKLSEYPHSVMQLADGSAITKQPDGTWKEKVYPDAKGPVSTRAERDSSGAFLRLPDLSLTRNGLSSWTLDRDVANAWAGTNNYASGGIDRDAVIATANADFKTVGGYNGVKAMVRAKWETTQYLLDRAGIQNVEAYRAISVPHVHQFSKSYLASSLEEHVPEDAAALTKAEQLATAVGIAHTHGGKLAVKEAVDDFYAKAAPEGKKLGDALTAKYGSPAKAFANLGGHDRAPTDRVVLRADVPRTAVLSIPAYGVNYKKEHEVVLAGTGWHDWDAWSNRAPNFKEVPMKEGT
jgi:hypothetical protein